MPKPNANFIYTSTGLSVKFTDSSAGVPTSWSWTYKDNSGATIATSTLEVNTQVFPAIGVYKVILVSSNASGNSDPYIFEVLVDSRPVLSLTIEEMVAYDIPAPLATNTPQFRNLIQKWQLFLQPFIKPNGVLDADIFNEAKWPPIANVLISKLVAYDFILKASIGAMTAYAATMQLFANHPVTTQGTLQVADFTAHASSTLVPNFGSGDTVSIVGITINGLPSINSGPLTSWAAVQTWLNTLGVGLFQVNSTNPADVIILSYANSNILTLLGISYTIATVVTGYNTTFLTSNVQLSTISQSITVNGEMPYILPGALRKMDTGPSKTEWYDASTFWNSMFKSTPGDGALGTGGSGGIMQNFVKEICSLAARLGIRLPLCPKIMTVDIPIFINSKAGGCCGRSIIDPNLWYWDNFKCQQIFYLTRWA